MTSLRSGVKLGLMKKLILILFFIFSFLNIQSVSAKTVKWDFEVKSTEELIKCIKVLEVKSKRSLLSSITGMGIVSETPTIVKLQNNCKEGIKGWFRIKLLDEDGFMIDDWLEDFSVGRKALTKNSFEFLTSPLKWKKIKSVLLEFDKLETY